jgi:hypothetical protein
MHCHLVPYFHYAAVHLEPQFLKHGPGPGWWTYAYERNNSFLGRFNTNGHSGGELEGTMMRGWWKATLIQDLVSQESLCSWNRLTQCTDSSPGGALRSSLAGH